MPLPHVPRTINGPENQSSGRLIAVIQETHDNQNRQAVQEPPKLPPTFNLKTHSLSPNIVEASRRAINDANQYPSQPAQNTNSGSGWGPNENPGSTIQSPANQYSTTRSSTGQMPADQASANASNRPAAPSQIRMASMSTDLNRLGNSTRRATDEIDATKSISVDPNLLANDESLSSVAASSQETGQTPATPVPAGSAKKPKTGSREKISITNTVQKVAISTIVVLVLCVAAMVILKKLGFTGPEKKAEHEFDVIETKKISGKCLLQLVTIRNHKVIVGIDQSGIKSMVCLPPSFADEYDEATSTEMAKDDASANSGGSSSELNDSSTIADLLATDLLESANRDSKNKASAILASATRDANNSDSNSRPTSGSEKDSEAHPIRSAQRRPPIRRFHSYEIAGGGNSGE